jgi:hypothetical protein
LNTPSNATNITETGNMNEQIDELIRIAEFLDEQHYSKTSMTIVSLTEMLRKKRKTLGSEDFARRVASIPSIFRDEFAEFCDIGQDYRRRCFDEVLKILLESVNRLGERSALSGELSQFISRMEEIDKNITPMAILFANLLVKKDRSSQESLVMFHSACYIYLIGVEGIFEDLTRMLCALVETSKGYECRLEKLKRAHVWDIRRVFKQLFGFCPVFLEKWQDKKAIRNAIAHAQAEYSPVINLVRFRSINEGGIFDKTMTFEEFQALHMETIDAIDSFKYSLRIMKAQALLEDCYNCQYGVSSL